MAKKTVSIFIILLISVMSVSFPVLADEEDEVMELIEPEESASGTDEWLSGWDYEIKPLSCDGDYIFLNQYTGTDPDVTVYGKAYVNGTQYPVCINVSFVNENAPYITGMNLSQSIVNLTFESVDGTKVRSARSDRLDDFFRGMRNLETVHFGGNFQGNVAQAGNMFLNCEKLESVDIETLDFGYASIYRDMFKGCSALKKVTINCPNGSNFAEMFYGCSSLTDVTMTGSTGKNMSVWHMFEDCTSLKNVDLSGMDFSKTSNFEDMFKNCQSLKVIDMSAFDFSSANTLDGMFSNCSSLESIDMSESAWVDDTISAMYMFYKCSKLKEIKLSEGFRPIDCYSMVYVNTPTLLRVKGTMSQEFRDIVLPDFEGSNRYLGSVTISGLIELEGKELEDCMFSLEMDTGGGATTGAFNYASNGHRPELSALIYMPGEHTFTVEEKYVKEKVDGLPVERVPISETEDFTCENAVRSKTVNIVRNTDGSLSVEE